MVFRRPARIALLLLACTGFGRGLAPGQDRLTTAQVAEAFELSRLERLPSEKIGGVAGSFTVRLFGPVARVARLVLDARQAGRRLAPENLGDEDLVPRLLVAVEPSQPMLETISNRQLVTAPDRTAPGLTVSPVPSRVWLEVRGSDRRMEPRETRKTEWRWLNREGGPDVTGRGLEAVFDSASLPPGDLEIAIDTGQGVKRWKLSAGRRARLR